MFHLPPKKEIYKTDKGVISMIAPSFFSDNMYEIYCIKGDLFDDIERYESIDKALDRISDLLY